MSMKNLIDTIGYPTRDLLTCSAVPQPTALPAACPQYLFHSRFKIMLYVIFQL